MKRKIFDWVKFIEYSMIAILIGAIVLGLVVFAISFVIWTMPNPDLWVYGLFLRLDIILGLIIGYAIAKQ